MSQHSAEKAKPFSIRLTETEKTRLEGLAGTTPLSQFIRERSQGRKAHGVVRAGASATTRSKLSARRVALTVGGPQALTFPFRELSREGRRYRERSEPCISASHS